MVREFVAKLYFTSPRARSILRRLGIRSEVEKELLQPRSIEYFWVVKNLDLDSGRILDVGSVGSTLPFKLACLGYEVYSIDVQELLQLKIVRPPNLKFIRGDIRHTNFQSNFFDRVIAISTIEHIGLGHYGDKFDERGDEKALKEIIRILKLNGKLLATVPYGKYAVTSSERIYDANALRMALRGLRTEKAEYFMERDGYWVPATSSRLAKVDSSKGMRGIACIVASKK